MSKRFYIVDKVFNEVIESGIELISQGFERKEDACEDILDAKIIIDRINNYFYFCDERIMKEAIDIISIKYPEELVRTKTNLNVIKGWKKEN